MKILILESQLESFVAKEVKTEINQRKGDSQTVFDWIADFFSSGGKMTPESFRRNLDINWFAEKLNYISKNGTHLDVAAMLISNNSKMQIEDKDIIDFISDYKSVTHYWRTAESDLMQSKMNYYSQEEEYY